MTKVIRHDCPNGCGWYRDSGQGRDLHKGETAWDEQVIDHPLYGIVTKATAAARDIAFHDCGEHKAALGRLRAAAIRKAEAARKAAA
jgi:hypothetical protein